MNSIGRILKSSFLTNAFSSIDEGHCSSTVTVSSAFSTVVDASKPGMVDSSMRYALAKAKTLIAKSSHRVRATDEGQHQQSEERTTDSSRGGECLGKDGEAQDTYHCCTTTLPRARDCIRKR